MVFCLLIIYQLICKIDCQKRMWADFISNLPGGSVSSIGTGQVRNKMDNICLLFGGCGC